MSSEVLAAADALVGPCPKFEPESDSDSSLASDSTFSKPRPYVSQTDVACKIGGL